ncbi:MAG: hypothetical protein A2538_04065 [Candidatus Magasanikbacteria bacterium RIFOXYD2_FULL_41_14]|uniref:Uncharacterized protein n=1 Tax=Candidatus Magasanikbacteria bacterium RIFOXYD2_FULL_41_14 TaxID=1798709 RepID=A0A1F6PFY6_9BACT|nr:MAG: hypothetical protein A2538_04065 [Candidatus Magasanikbacteria bacterium RIFOXYD2_FULL_41_14]
MKIVSQEKINKQLTGDFNYYFEVEAGIFLIEITARAKSWWQNFKKLRAFFKDDDLDLFLDNSRVYISTSNDRDVAAIWNGNELNGLSKIVLIAVKLNAGKHTLSFKPDENPVLENIRIMQLEKSDKDKISYTPLSNVAEIGDRRPWISCVLFDFAVKEISIIAKTDKIGRDDQDIKLVIDGKVEENENKNSHKDWYWCGKVRKGKEHEFNKQVNLKKDKHNLELYADNDPLLKKMEIKFVFDDGGSGKPLVRYTHKGILNNEDYNRYDDVISEVVSYWNGEFGKDTDPPPEPLDPNLVKALIFQESRMGYDTDAGANVMQVGNTGDPSILTLRGELRESWIHNSKLIPLKYDAKLKWKA